MPEPIASRDELLVLLSEAARKGRVGAMKILLIELRRDQASTPAETPRLSIVDALVAERENGKA
jgi:hypothetical protein